MANKNRLWELDVLKGIAIIAVVLYHANLFKFGYLGVDLFLVINGYLITLSLLRAGEKKEKFSVLNYIEYLQKRILRLWLPVIVVSIAVMIVGYCTMLPDDLENLSASTIATNLFLNNILARITSKNYWDVTNTFKPLMHTWYLGIIVQFYVAYIAVFMLTKNVATKNWKRALKGVVLAFGLCSLVLYLLPSINSYDKFYYLPFRVFEFMIGAVIALTGVRNISSKKKYGLLSLVGCASIVLMLLPEALIGASVRLISVSALAGVYCFVSKAEADKQISYTLLKPVELMGEASYSIFIWHQPVLALYRYIVRADFIAIDYIICLLIIIVLSTISYIALEKKPGKILGNNPWKSTFACCGCLIVICLGCFKLYTQAGVVRDIPELGVDKDNIQRGIWSAYNSRVYDMDVDFQNDERIKVLAIGNSYARDWVNILLEAGYEKDMDITYIYHLNDSESYIERIQQADYIFTSFDDRLDELPEYLLRNKKSSTPIYGIGIKRFGNSNNNIYQRRFDEDYLQQTAKVPDDIYKLYVTEKEMWGEYYIDMITPVLAENGQVSVFTPSGKFISQDCHHLTQAGAVYYADIIDFENIFSRK